MDRIALTAIGTLRISHHLCVLCAIESDKGLASICRTVLFPFGLSVSCCSELREVRNVVLG